ncbi:hypothetical protein [Haloarchaeobius sp. HME9146]|uniref:hypothetical protein n=1 Tax=unclassified Haloarchaeobius TaxID=2614452 RepID=UPI0021BFA67A|nr:hypothetical protein [Haloarchaeobius sp. HME9146]MCT9094980.1 hypothetical protein [Haloarchaeobius sp. HME9146]
MRRLFDVWLVTVVVFTLIVAPTVLFTTAQSADSLLVESEFLLSLVVGYLVVFHGATDVFVNSFRRR